MTFLRLLLSTLYSFCIPVELPVALIGGPTGWCMMAIPCESSPSKTCPIAFFWLRGATTQIKKENTSRCAQSDPFTMCLVTPAFEPAWQNLTRIGTLDKVPEMPIPTHNRQIGKRARITPP